MAKQKMPAKRKDPPVSRRQVFLRSEHLKSALDSIRLYRSNAVNAVQYVLLYASRTGCQLCFAATQQKEVSPADAGKTPNWLSLIFEVEAVSFLIHRHEAIAGLTYAVTEINFEGHAGVLAIQPLRAHIGRKVVHYADSVGNQFIAVHRFVDRIVIGLDRDADGSGNGIERVVV